MYKYRFKAEFVSSYFEPKILQTAIKNSENTFNALKRKASKHLDVRLDEKNGSLDIELSTDIYLAAPNYLRAVQYFSKVLSTQPGLEKYICGRRLLRRL